MKKESFIHIWIGSIKKHIDHFVNRDQRKFVKEMQIFLTEACITQQKLSVCDFEVQNMKL